MFLYTTVDYYLWARDKWITPNSNCDPVGAPNDGYYSFHIRPVGVVEEADIQKFLSFSILSSNPLKGHLKMVFNLPMTTEVKLQIFDILGRCVKVLVGGNMDTGHYEVIWSGRDENGRMVADGVYFLKFSAGNYVQLKKIVLVK
ncbi:MAG: FlgD immunoglobulin-like domain containing protein [bacterium]